MARSADTERGGASAELVIATPLLLLLLFGIVQFALWQHASHVVEAAAQEGARSSRLHGGTVDDGRSKAHLYLDQMGRDLILDRQVDATRTSGIARVEVSGRVQAVIPALNLSVHAVSEGPVERFISGGGS